jgi:hypothetical protein
MLNRFSRFRSLTLLLGALAAGAAGSAEAQDRVVVNGAVVSQEQLAQELARFGIALPGPVPGGIYWYDPYSGLWGQWGGPTEGQLPPGLRLGGELRADASGGGTGVFINGRELHPAEVAYLQQLFGYVLPGRYWLDAQGIGGVEGGPPMFNLAAQVRSGDNGYLRRGLFGSTGSDGDCFYYLHPNGSSVMNCE